MASLDRSANIEARHMELRAVVRLAGELIAQYWPMRTFVHHNPLHSLEYLPFEETVRRGKQFLGGQGYLPSDLYRHYLRTVRIQLRHLDDAVAPRTRPESVTIGLQRVSHAEVLRACLAEGLCTPLEEPLDARWEHDPYYPLDVSIAERLETVLTTPDADERVRAIVDGDQAALGRWLTLSHWCDRALGTQLVDQINRELIKWCEAFLDEGHATWPMPGREHGLYLAWKALASREWSTCGIADSRNKIAALPEFPEDALLESLDALGIPEPLRQDYLSLQLTALPGWAGFIKWRGEEREYEWQRAYPAGLVKYLAIRLWYARELVQKACRDELGIDGTYHAVAEFLQRRSREYFLRRERIAGRLPAIYAEEVDRLRHRRKDGWDALFARYRSDVIPRQARVARHGAAKQLRSLALALQLDPATLLTTEPGELSRLVDWMKEFPESDHGPVWLKAFEAGYQERLLGSLARSRATRATEEPAPTRPHSQSVFCIDVRSEPFRRHLEASGANETYGFAGFFAAFIRYRAWGREHDTEQFPVIMRAKNEVREIPRSYLDHVVSKHEARTRMVHAGHTLLHDLKENVVTPYVMVESLGWFYGLPIVGKTLLPDLYRRWTAWLRRRLVPTIATTLTVDKLAPAETADMLAAEQQAAIRQALKERTGLRSSQITPAFVEMLRQRALSGEGEPAEALVEAATKASLSPGALDAFVVTLRQRYEINQRSASRQKERITRTGFTIDEQVLTVDGPAHDGAHGEFRAARAVLRARQHVREQSVRVRAGLRRLRRQRRQAQRARAGHDGQQSESAGAAGKERSRGAVRHALLGRPGRHDHRRGAALRPGRRAAHPSRRPGAAGRRPAGSITAHEPGALYPLPRPRRTVAGSRVRGAGAAAERGLEPGAAGVGPVEQHGLRARAAGSDERPRPRRAGLSPVVRLSGRPLQPAARSVDDRAAGRGPVDQHGTLFFDGG
jgi:uncharacterized protein YbcC (UPF0753/DUF2309 family)